jgi:hypothetical protein
MTGVIMSWAVYIVLWMTQIVFWLVSLWYFRGIIVSILMPCLYRVFLTRVGEWQQTWTMRKTVEEEEKLGVHTNITEPNIFQGVYLCFV